MSTPESRLMNLLNSLMRDALGADDVPDDGFRYAITPTGSKVKVPENRRSYHVYWFNGWGYAYTSFPDEHGDYFAWTYKPKGKGSRTNRAKHWTAVDVVTLKHKGKAIKRAADRYNRAVAMWRREVEAKNA